ncbi:MAG TPA: GspH/FimT family protein [Gemmatimonadales bacterium]|nr:GspH/FimT family protein [Gemmatimonadales bacterium]
MPHRAPPARRRGRRGVTLVELVLVLAVVGILSGLAVPPLAALRDRLAVEAAARRIVALHQSGRVAAVLRSRTVVFTLSPDALALGALVAGDTLPLARVPGPAADGVTLTGPKHPIVWSPTGFAAGVSNGTWHLTRGAAARDVIVSRLGRVRVVRP